MIKETIKLKIIKWKKHVRVLRTAQTLKEMKRLKLLLCIYKIV